MPIYETSSAEQIEWILGDSGAVAVVAEGPAHTARIAERRSAPAELNHVWSLTDNAIEVLRRLGDDISDDELESRRTTATPLDLATVIYTSGTTGRPKGCMLTHGNFMFELGVAVPELHELFEPDDASTLLFLPLAHVFARIIQIGAVKARVRLGHSADVKHLLPDLDRVPADVRARGPARLREGLQHRVAAGDGRGSRRHLRPRRRHRDRLLAGPRPGQGPARPARPARGVLPARLRQAARRARRQLSVRRLRRRPARRPARPLLPGHRADGARGLRAHRDHGRAHRQPSGRGQDRDGRPAAARAPRCGSPRTASCCSAAARSSPATGENEEATAEVLERDGLVPHRRRRARSTRRASSGSPGGRRRSW